MNANEIVKKIHSMKPQDYLFLDEDSDNNIIDDLNTLSRICKEIKETNTRHYKEIITYYNKIVKETAIFLKSIINSTNEITICAALSELLWQGNLSLPKKFMYSTNIDDEEISGYEGINILYGKGCCRNISEIVKDILICLNYDVKTIINCEYKTNAYLLDTQAKRYDDTGSILNRKGIFNIDDDNEPHRANHKCIMFLYNLKNMLVYDPTNICIYKLNKSNCTGEMLSGNGKIQIYPHSLMLYNDYTYEDMNNFVEKIDNLKRYKNPKNVIELFQEGIKSIVENKSTIDDFYKLILPELNAANEYRIEKTLKK